MTGAGKRDEEAEAVAGAGAGEGDKGASFPTAPGLLSSRADPLPLPPTLQDAEVVAALHRDWAQLAGAGQGN
ncbi:MAG: hypothetical protein ACRDXC_00040, partial [Acidimicrobiales bacterium]